MLRLQCRTTNTQRFCDFDATKPELKSCFKVASTLDSKFNSRCNMNTVLTTLVQRWNRDVKFNKSTQRR